MRLCLLPLAITPRTLRENLHYLEERLEEIAPQHPDLVCLPECALTGYLFEAEDLENFAEPIPSPATHQLARLACRYKIFLCAGLLERSDSDFFNSAVLIDPQGQLVLHHRKICEQPPFTMGKTVQTELGRLAVLICGDLFDEDAVTQLDRKTDLLLVPMARGFSGRSPDPELWQREERQVYLDAVRAVGVTTAIVNALERAEEDASFGGALLVNHEGRLLAESPHGAEEALIYDLERAGSRGPGISP